jgi:hypothetical protein
VERTLPADPPADLLIPPQPVSVFGARNNADLLTILTVAVRARDLQLGAWREWWTSAKAAAKP